MRPPQRVVMLVMVLLAIPSLAVAQRKEKAEAIKTAARVFGADSKQALESFRALLQGSLVFTTGDDPQAQAKMLKDAFASKDVKDADIPKLVRESLKREPQPPSPDLTGAELLKLEQLYSEYSVVFDSLPQGAWFAKGAVTKSEALTLKLTKQLSSLADKLLSTPEFGEPISQESAIAANILRARAEKDSDKRSQEIDAQVAALIALKAHFESDRDAVIKGLLAAAEAGNATYKLIVDFEKIKLIDILSQMQSLFGALAQSNIPGPRSNLKQWNDRIKSGLDTLQKNPDTSALFQ